MSSVAAIADLVPSEPEYLAKEIELLFILTEMGFSAKQIEEVRSLLRQWR